MKEYDKYRILPSKRIGSAYEILPKGSGKVAQELRGLYTSYSEAIAAIDNSLRSKASKPKGKTSANKAITDSGS